MKIAHLLIRHSPVFGAAERYAVELANEQARQHEVSFILASGSSRSRPDALAHRLDPRVLVIPVPGWQPLSILAAHRALLYLAPDVAHAHLAAAERAIRGLRGLCLRVATLHHRYDARRHRHLDALIALSPWQLAEIPEQQRANTRQINTWTAIPPFDAASRRRIRSQLGLGDGDFLVGALGCAEHRQGLDVLIGAFTRASPADARLAIVGSGRQWPRLRRQAPAAIIMPGFTDQPHDWLCAFDALVDPARDQPVGLVLLEAMATGLPILATATSSARQLAPLIGRPLARTGSAADLAQALKQLASERPPRQSYDLGNFQLQQNAGEIGDFYQQQLSRQPAYLSHTG